MVDGEKGAGGESLSALGTQERAHALVDNLVPEELWAATEIFLAEEAEVRPGPDVCLAALSVLGLYRKGVHGALCSGERLLFNPRGSNVLRKVQRCVDAWM